MTFTAFDLEYTQSLREQKVDFNLTESGVHPLCLNELISNGPDRLKGFLRTEINDPHVNGDPELRQNNAARYDGAGFDKIPVTAGATEACNIIMQTLMEKLCREVSVFVGAGDSFGMDHHLRIAFEQERRALEEAFGESQTPWRH